MLTVRNEITIGDTVQDVTNLQVGRLTEVTSRHWTVTFETGFGVRNSKPIPLKPRVVNYQKFDKRLIKVYPVNTRHKRHRHRIKAEQLELELSNG